MKDPECVAFLQWCLPRLHLRWRGFRKVRRRVCKRVDRRLVELGLDDVSDYRRYLEEHPEEWAELDRLCRIVISRFWRDPGVFERLGELVLPRLAELASARGERTLRCWSAGCASGEEAYTLRALWELALAPRFPELRLEVVGTDVDEPVIERARRGVYPPSSLREIPAPWRAAAFEPVDGEHRLRERFRAGVRFLVQDLRTELPDGPFHLVVCRNLAFTYFDEASQREAAMRIASRMAPGGALLLGVHESLPEGVVGFGPWEGVRGAYSYQRPDAPVGGGVAGSSSDIG